MIIHECAQKSDEWHILRSKNITGSTVESLFVKGKDKSGYGAVALTKAKRIAIQRANPTVLFQDSADDIGRVKSVARGNDLEPMARTLYEIEEFTKVREVGFCECEGYGCSPDGLVGEDGGIEIKCLSSSDLYFDALVGEFDDYTHQLQFFLFVTGRKWIDFINYYPEHKQKPLVVKRFYPDLELHKQYAIKLKEFDVFIDTLVEKIKAAA